jgi:hypothetical protein
MPALSLNLSLKIKVLGLKFKLFPLEKTHDFDFFSHFQDSQDFDFWIPGKDFTPWIERVNKRVLTRKIWTVSRYVTRYYALADSNA